MIPSIKIALINHSFQINYYSRRWELFAEKHPDVDVTLLAPSEFEWYKGKDYSFGDSFIFQAKEKDSGNFHIRTFRVKNHEFVGWDSPDMKRLLCDLNPNVIYHIGTHNMLSLKQVIKIRNKYLPQTKVIAFSMRGPALNLRKRIGKSSLPKRIGRLALYYYLKQRLNYINKNVDAFFCHYPDAVKCFRDEGYEGPIYMQTQVGVNEEWFHEDLFARKEIRSKYNISESTYVFGSATRFSESKGVDIVLKALPKDGDWLYLMMGSGNDEETSRLHSLILDLGIENKVIETGFVDWYEISKYWNAVDCAIHVPLTTQRWEETFSLSIVQPMLTKKPVIGDTSGSVPYQIGYPEMIVPEGDIKALNEKIRWVLEHKKESAKIGEEMYKRAHDGFAIEHLNDMFYETLLEDVLVGRYDSKKIDMANYITKLYD